MTQEKRVIDYMRQYGSITALEAFRDLGVTRLSGVIYKLKKKYPIGSKQVACTNRYGETRTYSRYFLVKGAQV